MAHKALTLSIVIPVFNEQRHLESCLLAIAAQTVTPTEVIVVDNNSTDESLHIARKFDFVTIINEPQQGIVFARNAGFNAAKSKVIGRIDADTILPPDWVAQVLEFYQDPAHAKQALTGGGYFYNVQLPRFNGYMQSQVVYRMNRFIAGHYILWGSNMALPCKAWQDVAKSTCEDHDYHEDLDLAIHLHRLGYDINYQTGLKVGVYLKRVWNLREQQTIHMERWPLTLRMHGYHLWWMGKLGNVVLWYVAQPAVLIANLIARLFNRQAER